MASVGVDTYTLRMIEQMTAPLRKMTEQMERASNAMKGLRDLALTAFAGGAVVSGIKAMSSAIGGLLDLMGRGVGIGQRFSSAIIDATMFRQKNLTALGMLLGKGKGAAAYDSALKIGGMTSASESEVVEQVRKLAGAGFKGGGLNRALAGLLDVHAFGGNEAMGSLSYYFQKFKGGLSVERDDVRMAAATAGVRERDLLKGALGVAGVKTTGMSDVQLGKAVEAAKKAGKLTGETMIEALLQQIKTKLDGGGQLGSYAKKIGMGSLSGLMSNLEEAPQTFLRKMKLEDLPGIKSLMAFIQRILKFFDLSTKEGQKLKGIVEDTINALFGGLDNLDSKALGRMFESAIATAKIFVKFIDEAWTSIKKIVESPDPWKALVGQMQGALEELGAIVGAGIIAGMRKALPAFLSRDEADTKRKMAEVSGQFRLSDEGLGRSTKNALVDLPKGAGALVGGLGIGGKLVDSFGKVGEGLYSAGGSAKAAFLHALGFDKGGPAGGNIKIDNVQIMVPPGTPQEQAANIVEQLRAAKLRAGTVPAGAGASP